MGQRCPSGRPARRHSDALGQSMVASAVGLEVSALGDQGTCECLLSTTQRCFDQREVEQVPLRVAAAEAVRAIADRSQ